MEQKNERPTGSSAPQPTQVVWTLSKEQMEEEIEGQARRIIDSKRYQDGDFVYKKGFEKNGNFPEGGNEENKSSCRLKNNL